VLARTEGVADMQLAAAAGLALPVDPDRLAGEEGLRVAAAVDDACQLQQLPESDRLAVDGDLADDPANLAPGGAPCLEPPGWDAPCLGPPTPAASDALASRAVGERTGYAPGTFCWADLTSTDQAAAKTFYEGLFGWEAEDMPVGDGVFYSMMRLGGRDVAAISPQPQQQRDAGVPPVWNSYVSVVDADAALERATAAGASAHAPAFDVLQAGRMAVLQDPQGAYLLLWQAGEHFGAQLVNEPGAIVWNELQSPDPEASSAFYHDLFGWEISGREASQDLHLSIKNGEANNGGIRGLTPPGAPPSWLVYFGVQEIDSALATVQELGGSTLAGPIDIGIAKIAVVKDPQGAVLALYAGMMEP
jgi:predicted enzyme related to lactoylglutathione lyase